MVSINIESWNQQLETVLFFPSINWVSTCQFLKYHIKSFREDWTKPLPPPYRPIFNDGFAPYGVADRAMATPNQIHRGHSAPPEHFRQPPPRERNMVDTVGFLFFKAHVPAICYSWHFSVTREMSVAAKRASNPKIAYDLLFHFLT